MAKVSTNAFPDLSLSKKFLRHITPCRKMSQNVAAKSFVKIC